jgi:hypothetical protein
MFRIPLPSEDTYLLLEPRFGALTAGWQGLVLCLLLIVPAGLVTWLYRYELKLIRRRTAAVLLLVRMVILLLLWFVAGLQPTVARYHEEEVPSRVLVAVDFSASMAVRDYQRTAREKHDLAQALRLEDGPSEAVAEKIDALTRSEIVRRILAPPGLDWLARLEKNHQVKVAGFDRVLWEISRTGELMQGWPKKNLGVATDLRLPLTRALEPAPADQGKLLGVVIFTDGQHNTGPSPLGKAKELAEHKIPIYPVLIGAKEPPADIAVLEVKAPSNAFKDSDVQIEARIKISGVPADEIDVELKLNGKATGQTKTIAHDGKDRVTPVRFQVRMEEIGTYALEIRAHARSNGLREISLENNIQAAVIRVAQEKARVLLVDGEVRWEHHYLASALLRDPTMKIDQVVFTQPRIGNLPEEKLAALGHPHVALPALKEGEEDPLNVYDCIVLGDVPAAKLPLEQRRRLERYVAQRGGTLVLLVGKNHFPREYLAFPDAGDDPLLKLLPVTEARAWQPKQGFNLALTPEGKLTPFLQLEATPEANLRRYADFPKHFWGLLGKPRPGAIVLAVPEGISATTELPPQDQPGVMVQQNYGFGRVLLLGIDSTWRWRYRVGDTYHHRFWGQVIRWAAADKLLPGGNRFVRFGSREPVVRPGQSADIAVRLAEDTPPLKPGAVMQVRLWRQSADGTEEQAALVPLAKNAKVGKLLEAQVRDLPAGQYRIEPDIPDLRTQLAYPPDPEEKKNARRDWFAVSPPEDSETFDLSANEPLLRALAEESKGRLFTPENVEVLLGLFARQVVKKEERDEQRIWQDEPMVWWTFGLLIGLLSVEWTARKWAGLP